MIESSRGNYVASLHVSMEKTKEPETLIKQNNTEKTFSPIGCAMNDKSYKI
jgi:hypothetical protein